jgi:15-cis-phytoene synthase/lycopene beta-cyclase
VVQTTCLHILLNKPVLAAVYLRNENVKGKFLPQKRFGQLFFAACFIVPVLLPAGHLEGTYMKLIVGWVAPIFFMLWTFAYQLLLSLPRSKVLMVPTLFLWIVDTLALQRGTWSIESGTKLGIHIWPHLEIEEAIFFLVTNSMIVMGSCAFDNAIAILDAFPDIFPTVPGMPPPLLMLKSLFTSTSRYDQDRLEGLQNALTVLAKKSRSFYLASGVFNGRLRIDLILLYGFCRVADDLIDDAASASEAEAWIAHFTTFLDIVYSDSKDNNKLEKALIPFPPKAQTILRLLPADKLPSQPLYELLEGFRMDLLFSKEKTTSQPPIQTEQDLERYATCVAATIGELCLSLVYAHDPDKNFPGAHEDREECTQAGIQMGRALQYINIVRDVTTDAETGRCYIPDQWLKAAKTQAESSGKDAKILECRRRILATAFDIYVNNRDAIENLPSYARGGIRVAVESYVEIGRTLRRRIQRGEPLDFAGGGKAGRASVPKLRRVWVGWRTMAGRRGST